MWVVCVTGYVLRRCLSDLFHLKHILFGVQIPTTTVVPAVIGIVQIVGWKGLRFVSADILWLQDLW